MKCSFVILCLKKKKKNSYYMHAVQFSIVWIMSICVTYTIHLSLFIIHVFASTDATYNIMYLYISLYTTSLVNPPTDFFFIFSYLNIMLEIESFICTKMRDLFRFVVLVYIQHSYSMSTYTIMSTGFCRKSQIYYFTGMEGWAL